MAPGPWWMRAAAKHLLLIAASGASVLAFTLVRLAFLGGLGDSALFTTLYPAVILVALFLGPIAGAWTVGFSLLSVDFLLMVPVGTLVAREPHDVLGLAVFAVNGLLICGMTAVSNRRRDRLKAVEGENLRFRDAQRAAETIAHLNQRLNLAVRAGGFGVWDWDIVGDQLVWDDQMYAMYGVRREDFSGAYAAWLASVHPDDRAESDEVSRRARAGEAEYDTEFRVVWPDGSVRHLRARASVERDRDGRAVRLIGVNEDVTDAKAAERERALLQAQLSQSQKMENLGSLAGGIAHDMNNVLAAILSLSSVKLATLPEADPQRRTFEKIAKAAERGGTMVQRLLGFARQGQVEEKPVDLNSLVLEELALLERTTFSQVSFEVDLDPGLPSLLGDPGALAHALMNLCINSFDAMEGSGTLTVRTKKGEAGLVELEISDTGKGMGPEVLARAVDPFFTTKPLGQGTGLGLSLVYTTVKAHHGQMSIQSEPGVGTKVRLTFPSGLPSAGPGPEEARCRETPSLAILLVDDDDLVRGALREALQSLCHRVIEASGGEAALLALDQGPPPDLVILDMNMPGIGGAQTLALLRRRHPDLPVLLATGRTDQSALNLVEAYPGVSLLPKPFTVEVLSQRLGALVT